MTHSIATQLTNGCPAPMLRVTADASIAFANPAARRLLLNESNGSENMAPPEWQQTLSLAHESNTPVTLEYTRAPAIYELTFSPCQDHLCVDVFAVDISHRRKNEEQISLGLAEIDKRLAEREALLAATRIVLEEHDPTAVFEQMTMSCSRILHAAICCWGENADPDTLTMRAWQSPGEHDAPADSVPAMLQKAMTRTASAMAPHRSFEQGTAVMSAPLMVRGEMVGLMGFSRTATAFTADDERLAGSFCELAGISLKAAASEQEKEQLEQQYRQAQKMEAIGQLAGGIAHDFNNILGGITAYADLLKSKLSRKPTLSAYAEKIVISAMRAAELTRQLLTFARRARVDMIPCDVHECIRQTVDMLRHTVDRSIDIRREFRTDRRVVRGDRAQLENALLNLGVNARDAMPEGGTLTYATDEVLLESQSLLEYGFNVAPGPYVRVSVADTGTGIPRKLQSRIFEPFFTTKETGKGTGLGLASVYGMVKQHCGYITVDSTPNEETMFRLYFPLLKQEETSAEPAGMDTVVRGKGRVLVIDDEEDVRNASSAILKDLGYSPIAVKDGAEGVAYFRSHVKQVDAVVLDLIMPSLGGLACFRELKQLNPAIKVVVASGYNAGRDHTTIMREGACAFVEKPFNIAQLSQALAGAMRNDH